MRRSLPLTERVGRRRRRRRGSYDETLYSLAPDGTKLWSVSPAPHQFHSGPAIGADGTLHAVNTFDGALYAFPP